MSYLEKDESIKSITGQFISVYFSSFLRKNQKQITIYFQTTFRSIVFCIYDRYLCHLKVDHRIMNLEHGHHYVMILFFSFLINSSPTFRVISAQKRLP